MLGTALKVKPILTFGTQISPVGRVRTKQRALERMNEYLRGLHDRGATDGSCNTRSHPKTPSIWSLRAPRSSARVRRSAPRRGPCSARTSAPECSRRRRARLSRSTPATRETTSRQLSQPLSGPSVWLEAREAGAQGSIRVSMRRSRAIVGLARCRFAREAALGR